MAQHDDDKVRVTVPRATRDLAKKTARNRGMTTAEFIADAIRFSAQH